MEKRFVSIWFRHLATDWFALGRSELKNLPMVIRTPLHGKMIITATNSEAERKGISKGMAVADAMAIVPDMEIRDDVPGLPEKLLARLADWCIRFSPVVSIDLPDGLLMETTGCSHLWGGDVPYLKEIVARLSGRGYDVMAAMADTIGSAWGVARFGKGASVIEPGRHIEAMLDLPPESLRLESEVVVRLHKLGLHKIRQFFTMPPASLRRRFGQQFISRLGVATGNEMELLKPVQPTVIYQERLPCPEPIVTLVGIQSALQTLLEALCCRLQQDQKGLRSATMTCYRVDGEKQTIRIGTNRPSHNVKHLYKLFDLRISIIAPALGIELFVLDAPRVEENLPQQEKMWNASSGLTDMRLSELLDRIAGKAGAQSIHRYLPEEHYWPERSFKSVDSLLNKSANIWRADKIRPLHVLKIPEQIEVTAPVPDYPPMLFRHQGRIHKIVKADGPERIEQEWWLHEGKHRDYYRVEDETGARYWLFRLGHYDDEKFQWFLHGFFV